MSLYFRLNSSLPWTTLGWVCSIKNFFTALKVLSKVNQLNQEEGWFFSSPKTPVVKIKHGITLNNLQRMGPALWCWKMIDLLSREVGPCIQAFMEITPEMVQRKSLKFLALKWCWHSSWQSQQIYYRSENILLCFIPPCGIAIIYW